MKTTIKLLVVLTLLLALMLPQAGTVHAASITVTTTVDELNADGDCSLREAIQAANTDIAVDACPAGSGADTITVPANTNAYTLTMSHLFIKTDMTINGSGTGNTIIEQTNPHFRVIDIGNGNPPVGPVPVVSISKLTIKGGHAISPSNSEAFFGHIHGAGIHNHGILTLTNVTITGNVAQPDGGGGLWNANTATIVNVTIADNSAPMGFGGGIGGAPSFLKNTILANNTGGNCSGPVGGDHNLQFPGTACLNATTADPMLGPLTNGVYPLLAGSPAIDTGASAAGGCPPIDQLGTARPVDGDATPGAVCDIGSIEAPAFVAPAPMCNGQTATVYVNAQGIIVGGAKNGQVFTGALPGTAGADVIVGTNGKEEISARGGNDVICGGGNNDELEGGAGNDRIFGEGGNDIMAGEGGNDTLTGGLGADRFNGGAGTDTATDFTPGQGDTKSRVENF